MKYFLKKLSKFVPILVIVAMVNLTVDPANIYKEKYEEKAAKLLLSGKNVAGMTNYDERILQEELIKGEHGCPDTIIIGSSRVMTLSNETIGIENYRNHGVSGAGIFDYMGILGVYESCNKMPKKVIIGIDPWVLNENNGDTRYQSFMQYVNICQELIQGKNKTIKMIKKISLEKEMQLLSIPYFQSSIHELVKDPGKILKFENTVDFYSTEKKKVEELIRYTDGSIDYGYEFRERSVDTANADARTYVSGEVYQMENFDSLSILYCDLLEKLVGYLQNRKVEVVFYLPPYHPYVYNYIETSEKYQIVLEVENYLRNLALEKGIEVYGSYDPDLLGCTEKDFLDGMHMRRVDISKAWNVL